MRIDHFVPMLRWPRPNAQSLQQDFFAGLTVGLMLVPQAVAYAALAGMPLETGLYASIAPVLVATLLASSARLGVGPAALTALMVSSALLPMAIPGSADWVTLAIWLSILAGLIQLAIGLFRLDWLLTLITAPIMGGFTQAAALLIMGSQVPQITGIRWAQWWQADSFDRLVQTAASIQLEPLAYGLVGIAAFTLAKRLGPRIPSALLILAAGALLSYFTGYAGRGGTVIGELRTHLPTLSLPGWVGWPVLGQLFVPALVIALVGFVEVAASAKKDHEQAGTNWLPFQDWIAQGASKIASGLSGSFATSASFSRSAVNLYSGAASGWSTIITALFVLAATLWLTPALKHVPLALLAALVITAVSNLVKPSWFRQLWKFSHTEAAIALLTFGITLLASPRIYWGVLAGLVANMAFSMYRRLHPRILEVGLYPQDGRLRDRHIWSLPPLSDKALALRMDAPLDFASAPALEQHIEQQLDANARLQHLCLIASAITDLDATGLETLERIRAKVNRRGGILYLAACRLPLEQRLRSAGFASDEKKVRLLPTEQEAIATLAQL